MLNSEEIKKLLKKAIRGLAKPIIAILIIAIILLAIFYTVINGIYDATSQILENVSEHISINGNNIEIDKEYLEEAKSKLESLSINPNSLGFGENAEYLERFLEAEIVTSYPYLGGDGLQGAVYFERAKIDQTTIRLEYLEYNEFYNKVNNGEDVDSYFTVDQEDWTVHVMKMDGTIEKINYKNMVEKFAMPFEFPIALAMTSQNPQFALAVVNLVKDSRIIITIAESKTTTTTTNTEKYYETVTKTTNDAEGNFKASTVSEGWAESEPQVTTEETYSTDIFLSSARTWILNEITELNYDNSSVDDEPVVTELEPTSSTAQQSETVSVTTTKTERTNTMQVHRDYQRWIRGTSKVEEKSERFTKLIINDGATNGNGFVQIAKELHDYLAENQYYYSSQANVNAGRYVQDGEAISSRRPTYGEPMSERYLCCTTFSAWVLETAGYEGIGYGSLEILDASIKDRGWEVIEDIDDVEPGDICFWYYTGTTNLRHTNVCAAREADGTLRYYDAGSTWGIRQFDPILYLDRMGSIRTFAYAYRPNDAIAKALGADSFNGLKEDIEDYIEVSTGEGEYSVSVVNLNDKSESLKINNKRVKSNGLIKLFIMATAYSEVRAGRLNESDILSDVERMITTDSNTSANSLLKTIGKGDIAKGVDAVNVYARQNSYVNTKLEGELEQGTYVEGNDQTYTSVGDVATILQKIFEGTCVDKEYSDKMLELLKIQLITDMIPSTISNGEVRNKTGEQNHIIQDAAIISTENANYLIVVSASDLTNIDNGKNNIKEIANIVNLYFEKHGNVEDNSENYEKDDEIETIMQGNKVCYRLPSQAFQCPLNNLVEAREMLFELLGKSEKTQSHERLMRYLLYLLTGNDYGVTEFDFNEFLNGSFVNVGIGDYIVDTTKSPDEIVITDLDTLKKAFSWYSNDRVLQQYADYFLECQEKYHVNAVFAAAVSITESSAGTNIAIGGNNMFSISNGGQGNWNSYGTMESSIESFFKLISGEYFTNGQYTVSTIGNDPGGTHSYCVPPDGWISATTTYMTEMFKAAGINVSAYNDIGTEVQQWIANEARNNGLNYRHNAGYCLQWVQDIYQAAGVNLDRKGCATEAAWAWQESTSQSGIPLGAMVFGHAYGVNHGGHNAGHVGIYIGNGEVASNNTGKVQIKSLDAWISIYGWKGWGCPGI